MKDKVPNEVSFFYVDGFTGSQTRNTIKLEGDTWYEIVEGFTNFLRGIGYVIPYDKKLVLEGEFDDSYPSAPNEGPYDDDERTLFDLQATEGWK